MSGSIGGFLRLSAPAGGAPQPSRWRRRRVLAGWRCSCSTRSSTCLQHWSICASSANKRDIKEEHKTTGPARGEKRIRQISSRSRAGACADRSTTDVVISTPTLRRRHQVRHPEDRRALRGGQGLDNGAVHPPHRRGRASGVARAAAGSRRVPHQPGAPRIPRAVPGGGRGAAPCLALKAFRQGQRATNPTCPMTSTYPPT